MADWAGGHLCTACLERRLGRSLAQADYAVRTSKRFKNRFELRADERYVERIKAGVEGAEALERPGE